VIENERTDNLFEESMFNEKCLYNSGKCNKCWNRICDEDRFDLVNITSHSLQQVWRLLGSNLWCRACRRLTSLWWFWGVGESCNCDVLVSSKQRDYLDSTTQLLLEEGLIRNINLTIGLESDSDSGTERRGLQGRYLIHNMRCRMYKLTRDIEMMRACLMVEIMW